MKNNKFGFVLIILLLIVFVPAAIYGTYNKGVLKKEDNNPDHLPFKDGKLYYYEGNSLICSYKCVSNTCEDASTTVDDEENFDIKFTGGKLENSGKYMFINDGGTIKMVPTNGANSTSLLDLEMIKNYDGKIGEYLILKTPGENGYKLYNKSTGSLVLQDYDYIGVNRKFEISQFITKKDGQYYITNINGENITPPTSLQITDYTNDYVVYYDLNSKTYEISPKGDKSVGTISDIVKYNDYGDFIVVATDSQISVYSSDFMVKLDEKIGENLIYEVENNKVIYYDENAEVGEFDFNDYGKDTEENNEDE